MKHRPTLEPNRNVTIKSEYMHAIEFSYESSSVLVEICIEFSFQTQEIFTRILQTGYHVFLQQINDSFWRQGWTLESVASTRSLWPDSDVTLSNSQTWRQTESFSLLKQAIVTCLKIPGKYLVFVLKCWILFKKIEFLHVYLAASVLWYK